MTPLGGYIASKLELGDKERLRQQAFTRWLSRDLTQAAADFCGNLALVPLYSETSEEQLTRYLFWHAPAGAQMEVRSGRTREKFVELDQLNQERGLQLASLHINERAVHSAVWISPDHFEPAKAFLAAHGITPAQRPQA
jgi:hypothetical protein